MLTDEQLQELKASEWLTAETVENLRYYDDSAEIFMTHRLTPEARKAIVGLPEMARELIQLRERVNALELDEAAVFDRGAFSGMSGERERCAGIAERCLLNKKHDEFDDLWAQGYCFAAQKIAKEIRSGEAKEGEG